MKCNYCDKDPGTNKNGVWKGFQDLDYSTKMYVCNTCKPVHYSTKFKTPGLKNLYSEFPVVIAPAQLTLSMKTF